MWIVYIYIVSKDLGNNIEEAKTKKHWIVIVNRERKWIKEFHLDVIEQIINDQINDEIVMIVIDDHNRWIFVAFEREKRFEHKCDRFAYLAHSRR